MTMTTNTAVELAGVASAQDTESPLRIAESLEHDASQEPPLHKSLGVIAILTGVTLVGSISTGLVVIALPAIAADLAMPPGLMLWPASVYPLASACLLILAGCTADVMSHRSVYILGCFLLSIATIAAGLSKNGIEFIVFRALQGVAMALCLPTTTGLLMASTIAGRRRNVAFACIGLSQPFGFSIGMVMGGILASSSVGWRFGFYLAAGILFALFCANFWTLPYNNIETKWSLSSVKNQVDWIGAGLISVSLGLLAYVFGALAKDLSQMRQVENIVLLICGAVLIPAFVWWMRRQESIGRTPLIPMSIWKDRTFSIMCLMVLLSYGVLNSMEQFMSLFFQKVQALSSLDTAIRFIPFVIIGIALSLSTGLYVDKVRVDHLVVSSACITIPAPLVMALAKPTWPYWYAGFWGVTLSPICADVIFIVANLVIVEAFPAGSHALAGAVFNTVAQLGYSLGLMLMAIISTSATKSYPNSVENSLEAILYGYKWVYWACTGLMVGATAIALVGLRKCGKVGIKRD